MTLRLAIDGGTPVRRTMLPYGRQSIDEQDVAAVVEVLRSDWLTTGPKVAQFEAALAAVAGTAQAVAVSSGTAALHAVMAGLGVSPGDEVIVPALTFAATANAVVYQGGTPLFADVDPATLLIDPGSVAERITPRTRAVTAVDYAGQPCDYGRLRPLAAEHGLALVADACHAIGGRWRDLPVGSLAAASAMSFHPVKHVTTGEGGAVTTDDAELARRMRTFRNHGISTDFRQRAARDSWQYEMVELGFNYRLSDLQCALGISQLAKLPSSIARRQAIARRYDAALAAVPAVEPLAVRPDCSHAYHLYVVRLELELLRVDRGAVFRALRAEGIGVNVHYIPVHLHPYYREKFGTAAGLCPVAEAAYQRILSLPIFPAMTDADADDVLEALRKVVENYSR
ncbi:MAG: UDP-4-amino-4,6-dideoxy-N-acetyl-beta-L-altrosamine transaminase [Thermoguttaceae bacterium]